MRATCGRLPRLALAMTTVDRAVFLALRFLDISRYSQNALLSAAFRELWYGSLDPDLNAL